MGRQTLKNIVNTVLYFHNLSQWSVLFYFSDLTMVAWDRLGQLGTFYEKSLRATLCFYYILYKSSIKIYSVPT